MAASGETLLEFLEVMRRLQVECPWKAEQTHASLVPYLREEAAELAEAIEHGTPAEVCDELGDLLLQVFFHAVLAEQAGDFTIDDVAAGVTAKMRRRNPHVFDPASLGRPADAPPLTATEVDEIYQSVKRSERATD